MRSTARLAAALLYYVHALTTTGCSPSEAELLRQDRDKIARIVDEDVRASKAMGDVDGAARKGDVKGALDVIEARARPAIERGLRLTATTEPTTAWGRQKRTTLAGILEERRAELAPYTDALKRGDEEQLLAALEAQARIERRALAAVADLGQDR